MQVFKTFFKIARTKLPAMFIYLFIFGILMIMFVSSSNQDKNTNFKTTSLNVYVIDNDTTVASKMLTNYLSSMHNVSEMNYDKEVLLDNLFYRTTDYILEIPMGFEGDLISGKSDFKLTTYDIPNSYSSSFLDNQISSYLKTIGLYLNADYSLKDADKLASDSFLDASESVKILSFSEASDNSQNLSTAFYFQYLGYVMLLILIVGMTPTLITFRQRDLEKRMVCSSLTLTARNIQLTMGCFFFSITVWLLFLVLSLILYENTLTRQLWCYTAINSFVLMLVYLAISFLISSFAPNFNVLNMISNVLSLGMSFLCGIFVPQYLLGESVLSISRFLPPYWYIRNHNMIFGLSDEIFSTSSYWKYLGIQFMFALAIFSVSLVMTKLLRCRRNEG